MIGGGLADVVWEKDYGHHDEERIKGVVLPGRALAGQKRRQHMKEREKKRLDTVCRALSHISAHL